MFETKPKTKLGFASWNAHRKQKRAMRGTPSHWANTELVESDESRILPEDSHFRTSLIMPSLMARFSVLQCREERSQAEKDDMDFKCSSLPLKANQADKCSQTPEPSQQYLQRQRATLEERRRVARSRIVSREFQDREARQPVDQNRGVIATGFPPGVRKVTLTSRPSVQPKGEHLYTYQVLETNMNPAAPLTKETTARCPTPPCSARSIVRRSASSPLLTATDPKHKTTSWTPTIQELGLILATDLSYTETDESTNPTVDSSTQNVLHASPESPTLPVQDVTTPTEAASSLSIVQIISSGTSSKQKPTYAAPRGPVLLTTPPNHTNAASFTLQQNTPIVSSREPTLASNIKQTSNNGDYQMMQPSTPSPSLTAVRHPRKSLEAHDPVFKTPPQRTSVGLGIMTPDQTPISVRSSLEAKGHTSSVSLLRRHLDFAPLVIPQRKSSDKLNPLRDAELEGFPMIAPLFIPRNKMTASPATTCPPLSPHSRSSTSSHSSSSLSNSPIAAPIAPSSGKLTVGFSHHRAEHKALHESRTSMGWACRPSSADLPLREPTSSSPPEPSAIRLKPSFEKVAPLMSSHRRTQHSSPAPVMTQSMAAKDLAAVLKTHEDLLSSWSEMDATE